MIAANPLLSCRTLRSAGVCFGVNQQPRSRLDEFTGILPLGLGAHAHHLCRGQLRRRLQELVGLGRNDQFTDHGALTSPRLVFQHFQLLLVLVLHLETEDFFLLFFHRFPPVEIVTASSLFVILPTTSDKSCAYMCTKR